TYSALSTVLLETQSHRTSVVSAYYACLSGCCFSFAHHRQAIYGEGEN
ncbi:hypothetical protein Mettu_3644, partial [Methylobacter tundripaludum SV96]